MSTLCNFTVLSCASAPSWIVQLNDFHFIVLLIFSQMCWSCHEYIMVFFSCFDQIMYYHLRTYMKTWYIHLIFMKYLFWWATKYMIDFDIQINIFVMFMYMLCSCIIIMSQVTASFQQAFTILLSFQVLEHHKNIFNTCKHLLKKVYCVISWSLL